MKPNEYRCAMCKEVFEFAWTEEEAKAEALSKGIDPDPECIVCDDCYKQTPWGEPD